MDYHLQILDKASLVKAIINLNIRVGYIASPKLFDVILTQVIATLLDTGEVLTL